jgi:hypothetical protein
LVSHCRIHGALDLVLALYADNLTIEYTKLYDNVDTEDTTAGHDNMFEFNGGSNFTLRYSDLSNWYAEGFRPYSKVGAVYIYGNVWHDAFPSGSARVIEPDQSVGSSWGPIYFFNNTIVNVDSVFFSPSPQAPWYYAPGSTAQNNIVWNAIWGGAPNSDYNYYTDNAPNWIGANSGMKGGEPHSINGSGQSPFVYAAGHDYHIVPTTGVALPRNHGSPLSSQFGVDMDGHVRGADGAWDIGAYEYAP